MEGGSARASGVRLCRADRLVLLGCRGGEETSRVGELQLFMETVVERTLTSMKNNYHIAGQI